VVNELKARGVNDILIALLIVDGLKGFPEAITSVFPQTVVQTCIVHLIRNSLAFVSWKDRKAILPAIKAIYRAESADMALVRLEEFEAEWGKRYPAIGQIWRRAWEHVVPFFAFAPVIRKMIYTTDALDKKFGLRVATFFPSLVTFFCSAPAGAIPGPHDRAAVARSAAKDGPTWGLPEGIVLVWGFRSQARFTAFSTFFIPVSLFDFESRFFAPTHTCWTPARTGAVKAGRRFAWAAHSIVARPRLVWGFCCQAVSERRSFFLSCFLDRFLCSTWNPVSPLRPTRVGGRRAQGLSRSAVALAWRHAQSFPGRP
jgi:hypothetical protein